MKYKVIGWTYDMDDAFPDGEATFAVQAAIVDDIQKHGYDFTGFHHQEIDGCVPILNNGKKICMSRRGFGGVMAEAHGETGMFAYAGYAFYCEDAEAEYILPKEADHPGPYEILSEEELKETFDLSSLPYRQEEDRILLADLALMRYVESGDTVVTKEGRYTVLDVDRHPIRKGEHGQGAQRTSETVPIALELTVKDN